MKKGIRANLYLPEECVQIINNNKEYVTNLLDNFDNLSYDIYYGTYDGKNVCGIEFIILGDTLKETTEQYKHLKNILKNITGKNPKQISKCEFDWI